MKGIFKSGTKRHFSIRDVSGEHAFTIVEMVTVILIIAIMIGAVTVTWYGFSRRTDLEAASEIMMQDIRKTYAQADSGNTTNGRYDQYRIVINTGTGSPAGYPPNAYRIQRQVWQGLWWSAWQDVDIGKPHHTTVEGSGSGAGDWAKPTGNSDFEITYVRYANGTTDIYSSGQEKFVAFLRKGATTVPAVGAGPTAVADNLQPVRIRLRSPSQNKNIDIRISNLGKVWVE